LDTPPPLRLCLFPYTTLFRSCEWLPTRWPDFVILAAVSGYASAHLPWMKNVALTSRRSRMSSRRSCTPGVERRSGCSASKVSAVRKGSTAGFFVCRRATGLTGAFDAAAFDAAARVRVATLLLDARDHDAAREHALEDREE